MKNSGKFMNFTEIGGQIYELFRNRGNSQYALREMDAPCPITISVWLCKLKSSNLLLLIVTILCRLLRLKQVGVSLAAFITSLISKAHLGASESMRWLL